MGSNSKALKILEITTFFTPVVGGVETQVSDLAVELINKGYEVEVLTTNSTRGGKKLKLPSREVINIEQLDPETLGAKSSVSLEVTRVNTWFSLSQFHKFAPGFISKIWQADFDIIHVHGIRKIELYWALIIAKLKRKKIVVSTHNPFTTVQRSFLTRLYIALHDIGLGILLMRFVDKYALLASSEIPILKKFGISEKKMVVVGNAIHPLFTGLAKQELTEAELENIKQRAQSRMLEELIKHYPQLNRPLSKSIDRPWQGVVLAVGRFNKVKGFQHLEKAARELPDQLFLIIGGNDGYGGVLQNLFTAIPNVLMLSQFAERKELLNYFRAADIFVLPSLHEPFGIVLVEAMSQGCAVIASTNPGPDAITSQGKYGILVQPGAEDEILEKLTFLTNEKESLRRYQSLSLTRSKHYTWEKILPEYTENLFGM